MNNRTIRMHTYYTVISIHAYSKLCTGHREQCTSDTDNRTSAALLPPLQATGAVH